MAAYGEGPPPRRAGGTAAAAPGRALHWISPGRRVLALRGPGSTWKGPRGEPGQHVLTPVQAGREGDALVVLRDTMRLCQKRPLSHTG